jgi:hypothetical protein
MLRDQWKFAYTAEALAEAARRKISTHTERLEWWKTKKEEVTATIRSEGIEIDEKIALAYTNPKARDWDQGGEVLIRNDLRKQLAECYAKLEYHTGQVHEYDAWSQTLTANRTATLELDITDWLFFFGNDTRRT